MWAQLLKSFAPTIVGLILRFLKHLLKKLETRDHYEKELIHVIARYRAGKLSEHTSKAIEDELDKLIEARGVSRKHVP